MADTEFPKIIWVRMLKRLQDLVARFQAFAHRGKFNTILEECLSVDGNDRHRIMSIVIDQQDFDFHGGGGSKKLA